MDDFIEPSVEYFDDKKDPSNVVHIGIDIKGLRKSMMHKTASNYDIQFEPKERSFCMTAVPKDSKAKLLKYRFEVKRLPADVLADSKKTCVKVEKDEEVVVYLHKAIPGSWSAYLSVGLEHEVVAGSQVR